MPPQFEFPFPGENKVLSSETRAKLSGDFVKLSDGFTHYQLAGPEDAPVVVLVHGFSVPCFIWEPTFEALLSAGFQVLRYDLFGRGLSDRPFGKYDRELFDRQLLDLLDSLNITQPVQIIGLSMGGIITANFAVKHPKRVSKIVLIDPAGFPLILSFVTKLFLLPGIGEVLFSLAGTATLKKVMATDFYYPKLVENFMKLYMPQMTYKGFRRAILSSFRNGILNDATDIYESLGQGELPILLIWGRKDRIVPFRHSKKFLHLIPQIEFHPIDDVGHIPHYEKPEIVNPLLVEFLKR